MPDHTPTLTARLARLEAQVAAHALVLRLLVEHHGLPDHLREPAYLQELAELLAPIGSPPAFAPTARSELARLLRPPE